MTTRPTTLCWTKSATKTKRKHKDTHPTRLPSSRCTIDTRPLLSSRKVNLRHTRVRPHVARFQAGFTYDAGAGSGHALVDQRNSVKGKTGKYKKISFDSIFDGSREFLFLFLFLCFLVMRTDVLSRTLSTVTPVPLLSCGRCVSMFIRVVYSSTKQSESDLNVIHKFSLKDRTWSQNGI